MVSSCMIPRHLPLPFLPARLSPLPPFPSSISFPFCIFRTLWRNGGSATPLYSSASALFLSPRGCIPHSRNKMKQQTIELSTLNDPRCRHYTRNGRQCRLRVLDTQSGFCFRHARPQPVQSDSDDLSADRLGELSE